MKVILLADIKGTGKKGEIIEAKDGFCNNYLFPKKLAAEANKSNMGILDREKKQIAAQKQHELETARKISDVINGKNFEIAVKSGENGKLFGSVTNKEIAAIIEETTKISIDKKKIVLEEQLKTVGTHEVAIKIHPEIETKVNIILKAL